MNQADKYLKAIEMLKICKFCPSSVAEICSIDDELLHDMENGCDYDDWYGSCDSCRKEALEYMVSKQNVHDILVKENAIPEPAVYEYGGKHFVPECKLAEIESLADIILRSDKELGFFDFNHPEMGFIQKYPYSYKKFFAAMKKSEMDVFRCEENGKFYVPCNHELFIYEGRREYGTEKQRAGVKIESVKVLYHAEKQINEKITAKASKETSFIFANDKHIVSFYLENVEMSLAEDLIREACEEHGLDISDEEVHEMASWFKANLRTKER